jgi:CheY-like chemotaxis protein
MSSRILIVGDQTLRQSVVHAPGGEQVEAVYADDGMAAVFLLNETEPDLLIAEVALPGKSGYELCRYVRGEPEFQSLPVVLLDNGFDAFNQSAAYSAGADVYLSKPFEPAELTEIVQGLLKSKQGAGGEAPARADSAETNKRLPLPASRSSQEPTALPQAVPPPARNGRAVSSWPILAGIILIAIALAALEWTRVSNEPASGNQALTGDKAGGYSFAAEPQQAGEPSPKHGPGNTDAEAASPPEGNVTPAPDGRDEDSRAPQTARPDDSTGVMAADTEATQSEPGQDSPSAASREYEPDAGSDQLNAPPTRPRSVRPARTRTMAGHLKRSGQEMKQAGKHFGRGAKHLGQSGGRATVWAGKKVGRGVKGVGAALKKIF